LIMLYFNVFVVIFVHLLYFMIGQSRSTADN
jgi:hypothetical protein